MSLKIDNLHATLENGTEILKGVSLEIPAGEIHAIMGPNGSGKSTLSKVIAGHESYIPTAGTVTLDGADISEMSIDERSRAGIFLAFQYPNEVPGVSNANFIRAALQSRLPKGEEIDAVAYYKSLYEKMDLLEMDRKFTARAVNEGFSGGEKKRNEILQMMMLDPKYCVMDETDSGLDIDALKIVAKGVNAMRSPDRGMLLITHYQRLLDYIKPDHVHVMSEGRIVKSGGPELALELEEKGYDFLKEPALA
ncbi:MAG: Fe-S cluster assembly ATPase SufC [Akkermansiaceae bacterium]|jgi:Fe-S cluster assembly ATP-binding protein|nr:Fe-S cluster assembly ATPase SufC [Akkermansiaceae bacterium]MDP4647458.1 Fe-S cluster assembly ATPase SufC [Akkermansiaceae bacterium]MDP4719806.1 Fe-S cluster assembly ATPase SufC [Akkermansiaceae bacterium]MDP4780996.1 Fe-S cluster assembly ATPase SufC [Akkermansiaceae bacterium]MDP4847709.1 Fe-S cluster assembly ATPase SufC [Akkermansiaceae bacterium]